MCIKDKVRGKWLNGLIEKRICDPNSIFKLDCLPLVSSECLKNYKEEMGCTDGRKLLSTYFTELNKIKSMGLVHGLTAYEPHWTKLPMSRNSRGKGKGKEIDMKFVDTSKRFVSNRIIDDGSSNEFESEKDSFCKVREKKEESDFDSPKGMIKPNQCTTQRQKQDGAWMCKLSSSIKPTTPPHVNRLKLPKKKIYAALVTPEESGQDSLTKELIKQKPSASIPAHDSPSTSYNSQPIEAYETPLTGSCPLCEKVMSIAQLERHCSSCMGPDEGPRLKNTGLKGRKT